MPATFLNGEACLLTLRNLLMKHYDAEPKDGFTAPPAEEVSQRGSAKTPVGA
ncbi:MAG: hypothetical protein QM770_15735 [Tepidisphaeraceae bacterium]